MTKKQIRTYKRRMLRRARREGVEIPRDFNPRTGRMGGPGIALEAKLCKRFGYAGSPAELRERLTWKLTPFPQKLAKDAAEELGTTEWPAGSNAGKRVAEYLRSVGLGTGYPWCAAFVTWCLKRAGYDGKLPGNPAYVPAWSAWGRANGYAVAKIRARRGDLLCFEFDGDSTPDHIGICTGNLGAIKTYRTIEGNTSAGGSQDNGGAVLRKTRLFSQVSCVIRIRP